MLESNSIFCVHYSVDIQDVVMYVQNKEGARSKFSLTVITFLLDFLVFINVSVTVTAWYKINLLKLQRNITGELAGCNQGVRIIWLGG